MNSLVHMSYIPIHYKKGLLVPIPKANKDPLVKDNNRGITLLSVFYKLLEKVMIIRENKWITDKNVVDEIQSSGQANCSCLHTSFAVQEAIAYHLNQGQTVYGAFLDTRKAFDTVWINGLLYKLSKTGINCRLWLLIKSAYTDFERSTLIAGETGEWFKPRRGVHQGAPLSMILYTIYINELLVELKNSRCGISLGNINVTSPAHADDIATLSLYKHCLNVLLNIAHVYSYRWRYSFNTSKTVLMVWGKDNQRTTDIMFGGEIIYPSKTSKHMGITLCSDNKLMRGLCSDRIGAARKVLYSARGIGSAIVPVPPGVLSKLYWSVAVPKMMYGLDVTPIDEKCLNQLEVAHRNHAKLVQGLPPNIHKPAPLASIGWLSVSSLLALTQIMFLLRMLCLPIENVYRKIAMLSLQNVLDSIYTGVTGSRGPIYSMFMYIRMYKLDRYLFNCMQNGNMKQLPVMKKYIKDIIWNHEQDRWKATCILYKELYIYNKCIISIRIHPWWKLLITCPHLRDKVSSVLAIAMGGQPRGMQRNIGFKKCPLCELHEVDTPTHILFSCPELTPTRTKAWHNVLRRMPPAMVIDVESLTLECKTTFILSGLNCISYVSEWKHVYVALCEFVYCMYRKRADMYDECLD